MASLPHRGPVQWCIGSLLMFLTISLCISAKLYCNQNERQKDGKCLKCPICLRGEGLTEECGGGGASNAVCVSCTEGKNFSAGETSARCRPCRDCSLYNRLVRYWCRAVVDAECGACLPGYYEHHTGLTYSSIEACLHCSQKPNHPQCATNKISDESNPSTTTHAVSHPVSWQEDADDGYKIATIVLSVFLALSLFTIVCLVILYLKVFKPQPSDENGITPTEKNTFAHENRGRSFTESVEGNNNNEGEKLLPGTSLPGNMVDAHPYEVVPESLTSRPSQPLQHSQHGPTAAPGELTRHPQDPLPSMSFVEVDPPKTEVVFVTSGDPTNLMATTAAPSFLPPVAPNNVVGVMEDSPEMLIYSSDEDDGNIDGRASDCFSQASTLPVRSCQHTDPGSFDAFPLLNRTLDDSLGTTSLNDPTTRPNLMNFACGQNMLSNQEDATPVVCWRKDSNQSDNIQRPNVTTDSPNQQEKVVTSSTTCPRSPDMASIQITINNTIGQSVLPQKTLIPVIEVQESEQTVDDETEVKSVVKPTLFTRSCSMEDKACNPYSIPVQESVMEVQV